MALAAGEAAHLTPLKDEPGEKADLEPAFLVALARYTSLPVRPGNTLVVPGWNPSPGPTDVSVGVDNALDAVVELKVCRLDWCLWDMLKVASLVFNRVATAGYLVVVATGKRFDQRDDFGELFTGNHTLKTGDLFDRYRDAWLDLLKGGAGRPHTLPADLRTEMVMTFPLVHCAGWQMRVMRVTPVGWEDLRCVDGWPALGNLG
jgi:hypothetical protein